MVGMIFPRTHARNFGKSIDSATAAATAPTPRSTARDGWVASVPSTR